MSVFGTPEGYVAKGGYGDYAFGYNTESKCSWAVWKKATGELVDFAISMNAAARKARERPSLHEIDTRNLIAALEAYRDKYGFSFDASQPAKILIQELKEAVEANQ